MAVGTARPESDRSGGWSFSLSSFMIALAIRPARRVGTEAGELPALTDLVGVLDRVEVGRVDLVGEFLELAAVALDLGLDDRGPSSLHRTGRTLPLW